MAAQPGSADGAKYEQELHRGLGVLGNIAITVSAVTPASSVFIIVPFIILTAGTGAFLSMVFAAVIGVFMAYCWAELSAAFPVAGGDYALVWHAFRGPLGTARQRPQLCYLRPDAGKRCLHSGRDRAWHRNLSVVGDFHRHSRRWRGCLRDRCPRRHPADPHQRRSSRASSSLSSCSPCSSWPFSDSPIFHADRIGHLFNGCHRQCQWRPRFRPLAVVFTATASAVFAYNGYANAVNFSEETKGSSRHIATAILWSLVITVVAELIPTVAVLLGAPDLAAITTSSTPMIDFVKATANATVNTVVSLGIALAIFNATLAIILEFGRILYRRPATGRGPVSSMTGSPWSTRRSTRPGSPPRSSAP